jgi:hypothetical protein
MREGAARRGFSAGSHGGVRQCRSLVLVREGGEDMAADAARRLSEWLLRGGSMPGGPGSAGGSVSVTSKRRRHHGEGAGILRLLMRELVGGKDGHEGTIMCAR